MRIFFNNCTALVTILKGDRSTSAFLHYLFKTFTVRMHGHFQPWCNLQYEHYLVAFLDCISTWIWSRRSLTRRRSESRNENKKAIISRDIVKIEYNTKTPESLHDENLHRKCEMLRDTSYFIVYTNYAVSLIYPAPHTTLTRQVSILKFTMMQNFHLHYSEARQKTEFEVYP